MQFISLIAVFTAAARNNVCVVSSFSPALQKPIPRYSSFAQSSAHHLPLSSFRDWISMENVNAPAASESSLRMSSSANCFVSREDAQRIFDEIDIDGTGDIDLSELNLLKDYFPGTFWNKGVQERLMFNMDTNNDGVISIDEFHEWMLLQGGNTFTPIKSSPYRSGPRRLVISNQSIKGINNDFINGKPAKVDISYDDIQEIISVSRPYYSFENEAKIINESGEIIGFAADVSSEMAYPLEGGLMGGAEVARHMAIGGSVAAALVNPKQNKNHMLALDGFMRHDDTPPIALRQGFDKLFPPTKGKARIFAYCRDFKKREATSDAFLFTGDRDDTVWRITVTYKLVPTRSFKKLFPTAETIDKSLLGPWTAEKANPYTKLIDLPLTNIAEVNNYGLIPSVVFNSYMPKVGVSQCYGHFDYSPCLPVAFLIGHLISIGVKSVVHLANEMGTIEGTRPVITKEILLDADTLCMADTYGLSIDAQTIKCSGNLYTTTLKCSSDCKEEIDVATVVFTFELQ